MIDVSCESVIPFGCSSEYLPGRPHLATLHRWRVRGIRGVRLETLLIGGRRFTSLEALRRFTSAVTAAADGSVQPFLSLQPPLDQLQPGQEGQ